LEERKINKSIPMDPSMIEEIHQLMLEYMKTAGKPISFGEASRIILATGIHETKKRGGVITT
jgi:hypothetical protein